MVTVGNVEPGHPDYDALRAAQARDGGREVRVGGQTYVAVMDGDHVKFIPTQVQDFASGYASNMVQPHQVESSPFIGDPDAKASETRAPRTGRRKP